jgi:hypothetical protein
MLAASRERIMSRLGEDDLVLDVGGWAKPFARADWVIDLMPYETRGLYGETDPDRERFDARTWVERDICDREPWPFGDRQFDFVVCSHTLEDVRDPVWVCSELTRVAGAGYIEVPSRVEEQAYGIHGSWTGWSHHHWLIDVSPGRVEFVFKSAIVHGRESCRIPAELAESLTAEERVQTLFWEQGFECRERVFIEPSELDLYLDQGVADARERLEGRLEPSRRQSGLRRAIGRGRRYLAQRWTT